ncbi:MAG: hypothetical protein RSE13_01825 [Planktothrix sp. GU0601_MAG3]|nr:MAG: hypothetical protein RSE13_01825 [Planktothrix sp. GU0601_MAG3]
MKYLKLSLWAKGVLLCSTKERDTSAIIDILRNPEALAPSIPKDDPEWFSPLESQTYDSQ